MKTMKLRAVGLGLVLAAGGVGAVMFAGGAGRVEQGATAPAGAFAVDGVHSSVIFRIQRTGGAPFYGRFDEIKGSFLVDAADLSKSVIDVTVPTASVNSNNGGRDKHLKSQDFFSAEEFPELTFKSTSFKKVGEKEYEVAGNISLRGQSKPVTLKVKETGSGPARGGGTSLGLDISFTIKRSEFGVTKYLESLSDEVVLMVGLEGVKK